MAPGPKSGADRKSLVKYVEGRDTTSTTGVQWHKYGKGDMEAKASKHASKCEHAFRGGRKTGEVRLCKHSIGPYFLTFFDRFFLLKSLLITL